MISFLIKHLTGVLIFTAILFVTFFIEVADRIPFVASKLPMRYVVEAKQEVNLYECSDFRNRVLVKTLKIGETAELEYVACGSDTRWGVILSDGRKACYSASDEDKVVQKLLKFYYF